MFTLNGFSLSLIEDAHKAHLSVEKSLIKTIAMPIFRIYAARVESPGKDSREMPLVTVVYIHLCSIIYVLHSTHVCSSSSSYDEFRSCILVKEYSMRFINAALARWERFFTFDFHCIYDAAVCVCEKNRFNG